MRWFLIALALASFLGGAAAWAAPPPSRAPEFLTSPGADAMALPFSEAVRAGGFLYLAGQVGVAAGKREVVPGGIGPEATQVMENVKAVLGRHGASLDDVVKCT